MDRSERRRGGGAGIIAVLIIAVLLLVLVFVFRIREFNVSVAGESRHTTEEIRNDLSYDFLTKNTLYFAWKYRNATEEPRAPYLQSVRAKIISPSAVQVVIQEKSLVGRVLYNGNNVYFDRSGNVLEITGDVYEEIPLITGVTMEQPELYKKLPVNSTTLRNTMLSIAELMLDSKLNPDEISFDEQSNIFINIGTVVVALGQDEYLEEKVSNLETIYDKVAAQTGTLNMTAFTGKNETITFTKDEEETEAETEAPEGSTGETGLEPDDGSGTGNTSDQPETQETQSQSSSLNSGTTFQAFDSYGTLHNDAQVVGGNIVDSYGNPLAGCYINESGQVVDAYWNIVFTLDGYTAPQSTSDSSSQENADTSSGQQTSETQASSGLNSNGTFQAFDSNGTLHNDAQVINGVVVDSYGNVLAGCYINESNQVVDAYWNIVYQF